MDNLYKTLELAGGYKANIYYAEDADCPRQWDNLGTIYANSKEYDTDGHQLDELYGPTGYFSRKRLDKKFIWLPIYAYIHSGITVRTGTPYSDKWDSCLFGVIAVTYEQVRKLYDWKRVSPARKAKICEQLNNEVQVLDDYLTGDVYAFELLDKDGELVDSCSGYYGEAGLEQIEDEVKCLISEL